MLSTEFDGLIERRSKSIGNLYDRVGTSGDEFGKRNKVLDLDSVMWLCRKKRQRRVKCLPGPVLLSLLCVLFPSSVSM